MSIVHALDLHEATLRNEGLLYFEEKAKEMLETCDATVMWNLIDRYKGIDELSLFHRQILVPGHSLSNISEVAFNF